MPLVPAKLKAWFPKRESDENRQGQDTPNQTEDGWRDVLGRMTSKPRERITREDEVPQPGPSDRQRQPAVTHPLPPGTNAGVYHPVAAIADPYEPGSPRTRSGAASGY
jgi:hypothetical protein